MGEKSRSLACAREDVFGDWGNIGGRHGEGEGIRLRGKTEPFEAPFAAQGKRAGMAAQNHVLRYHKKVNLSSSFISGYVSEGCIRARR
jgi:hypothetical protein